MDYHLIQGNIDIFLVSSCYRHQYKLLIEKFFIVENIRISDIIIHQIFSLTRDWSKRVTWPNIPQLKLWNIREYSPILKIARVAKKIWRIIKTIAAIWGKNMHGYLSLDIICSSKLTVFLELRSRKTVRFSEQIMSADKYPCIFSRQMAAIVYIFISVSAKSWWEKKQRGRANFRRIKFGSSPFASKMSVNGNQLHWTN